MSQESPKSRSTPLVKRSPATWAGEAPSNRLVCHGALCGLVARVLHSDRLSWLRHFQGTLPRAAQTLFASITSLS